VTAETGFYLHCQRCGDQVLLPHTDETRQRLDITPGEGWEVTDRRCVCPCCAVSKHIRLDEPVTEITEAMIERGARAIMDERFGWNRPHLGIMEKVHREESLRLARACILAALEGEK